VLRRLSLLVFAGLLLGLWVGQGVLLWRAPKKPKFRGFVERPLHLYQQEPPPLRQNQLGGFSPLPEVFERRQQLKPTREEMDLGRQFFYDARFSRNHDISCNSCHPLDRHGMDGKGVSVGHLGQTGRRNAPTVYNSAGQAFQFWDGRARDVEEQARFPVLDPFEMAMDEARVVATLRSIPQYVEALQRVFPNEADPVTFRAFAHVVGAFERGLVTPARWDRFVEGDELALSAEEKRGFAVFNQLGCVSCHVGTLVGGGRFEVLGQHRSWPNQTDVGSGSFQSSTRVMLTFRVASLRNVAETAPYFHDASSTTLEDAVRRMAEHQLGVQATAEQAKAIATWLGSLTGALPEHYIQKPELPPSTEATPTPERYGY
jgi:cytochrome c peroxidase